MSAESDAGPPVTVPAVAPSRRPRLPRVHDVVQDNGLRVLAVRRPGVPRAEMRLRVPLVRQGPADDGTRTRLLAETLLSGTPARSSFALAQDLQRLGADVMASADVETLVVSGSTLSATLGPFLGLVAEAVATATFPADEVLVERQRVAQELRIALSQPGTIAHHALVSRLYGRHPYGLPMPSPDKVSGTGPARLRRFHAERVAARGSTLVMVGDFDPARAVARVEEAFGAWLPGSPPVRLPAPGPPRRGPVLIVDRPGSVQGSIRLGGPAVDRSDPAYPTLAAATAVFGGYFASRLWANLRERRGYTYSPSAGVSQRPSASNLVVGADVATEVVGPALLETRYELGRMAESLVEEAERMSGELNQRLQRMRLRPPVPPAAAPGARDRAASPPSVLGRIRRSPGALIRGVKDVASDLQDLVSMATDRNAAFESLRSTEDNRVKAHNVLRGKRDAAGRCDSPQAGPSNPPGQTAPRGARTPA